ncbi:MAG: hypothetical protein PHP22_00310 [Oscillospiraceae bacterium]|nr:hypothetical protein [Oscillospiraceae bacterium]
MTLNVENRDQMFSDRENELKSVVDLLGRRSFRLSTVRMLLFLASVSFLILYFAVYRHVGLIIAGVALLIALLAVVAYHIGIKNRLSYNRHLQTIHGEYSARTAHMFDKLKDDGKEFVNADHDYSSDLDLFGPGSLFHLMNISETYFGRKKLKELFLASTDPELSASSILERQEAVSELFEDPWSLQEFQAKGRMSFRHKHSPKAFLEYAADREPAEHEIKPFHLFFYALLSLTLLVSLLLSVLSIVNLYIVAFSALIVQLILTAIHYNRFKYTFETTEGLHRELYMYKSLFEWIEQANVKSALLKDIQSVVADRENTRGGKASEQLARLHVISLFIQARNQPLLFLILNTFFLYDMYCIFFLRKWIKRSGISLPVHLELLGLWEALGSLTMMRIIYPECSYPVFRETEGNTDHSAYFSSTAMGHPLIPVKRQVRNDFILPSGIALITGSNMSGKTTLLRTVGINAVLAYTGTICCADYLELTVMGIGSSMRIADNLEAGLSTFYAELLRIERIVRKSKTNAPLLFLIDEIFRGTNSKDRTDGAQLVIENLLRPWVIGMMSTHDYQLCEVMKEEENIHFYYFSEKYDEEGIHFDYRLSPGISTAANARYLMKMVGIE